MPATKDQLRVRDSQGFRSAIENSFNLEEIANLCADIGIDFENLSGSTKTSKSRELIRHCERNGSLRALFESVTRTRPGIDWAAFVAVVPDVTQATAPTDRAVAPAAWEPIRILGVIEEEVTSPRNGGTRGSGLYAVPLRLSKSPESEWSRLFIAHWNRPPRFSTMHRPGIARIQRDKVILDGTTIQEVEQIHVDTLKLVLQETNREYQSFLDEMKRASEQKDMDDRERNQDISESAKRIRFD